MENQNFVNFLWIWGGENQVKEKTFTECFYTKWYRVRWFVTKSNNFDIFDIKRAKNHVSKPPFQENCYVFRRILMINFHANMHFLWPKNPFMSKYWWKCVNKWEKSFLEKGGFELWPSKNWWFLKIANFATLFFWVPKNLNCLIYFFT